MVTNKLNVKQIKQNKLRIPTGGRLTSWLFTKSEGVEFGVTEDKSIKRQGGRFKLGSPGLEVWRPTLMRNVKTLLMRNVDFRQRLKAAR